MPDFTPSQPEKEEVVLFLKDAGLAVQNFTEYSFTSQFLTPTDAFSFTIGAERLTSQQRDAIRPGALVQLRIGEAVQATGYIDSLEISASRGSGTVFRINGRDKLAQAVDSGADPTQSLKEGQTLASALIDIFKTFGWSDEEKHFEISDEANIDVKSNKFRSKSQTSAAKGFGKRRLKAYQAHQNRPYTNESAFEFASRITQRLGLWLWTSADGDKLIVDKPNFEQEPSYSLLRNVSGTTNVLEGSVKYDLTDQPGYIIADTFSKGGEFGRGRACAIYINAAVSLGDLPVPDVIHKYERAGARIIDSPLFPSDNRMLLRNARIQYLHDDESQTQEHLEAYIRREMAMHQRKSLTANYTVEGHGQNTPFGFVIWTPNTTVKVVDEAAGLDETLYVLGRTFNKSRSSGTTTHLELIRLNTLFFTDPGK